MDRRGFLKNCALAAVSGGASTLLASEGTPAKEYSNNIRGYKNTMRYKYFGKTGEQVSVLGYGNMRLPVVNGD